MVIRHVVQILLEFPLIGGHVGSSVAKEGQTRAWFGPPYGVCVFLQVAALGHISLLSETTGPHLPFLSPSVR